MQSQHLSLVQRLIKEELKADEDVDKSVSLLTRDELCQIAEERGLSGKCGWIMCKNACKYAGRSKLKVLPCGSIVDLSCCCSTGCLHALAKLAERLDKTPNRLKNYLISHGKATMNCSTELLGEIHEKCSDYYYVRSHSGTPAPEGLEPIRENGSIAEVHADKANDFLAGQLSSLDTLLGYYEIDRSEQPNPYCQHNAQPGGSSEALGDFIVEEEDIDGGSYATVSSWATTEGWHASGGASKNATDTYRSHFERLKGSSSQALEPELSSFGQVYRLLDALVTHRTLEWVHNQHIDSCAQNHSPLANQSQQVSIHNDLEASYVWLAKSINLDVVQDSGNIHNKFCECCTTFRPVKSMVRLGTHGWYLIGFAILEAMSWRKVPELQIILWTSSVIKDLLESLRLTPEHHQALLGVFAEGRLL